jgi:hypothetical protein
VINASFYGSKRVAEIAVEHGERESESRVGAFAAPKARQRPDFLLAKRERSAR